MGSTRSLRFPLYKWIRGVGFVDAGNVFPRLGELSLADLAHGAGLGLRIDTPFGLARIDYGLPLTGRSGRRSGAGISRSVRRSDSRSRRPALATPGPC